jgi:hypothetical protein
MAKDEGGMKYLWQAYGKPESHRAAMQAFMDEEDVQEFRAI